MGTQKKVPRYAEGTNVSIAGSRAEIEKLLMQHDATGFLYGEQGNRAVIAFELGGRRYKMELHYRPLSDFQWTKVNRYSERQRTPAQAKAAYEQEKQRLWRGLALLVKAKLTAIADGVSTLEIEMQPYTILPNNQMVGEWLEPQIAEVYRTGKMPPLLPGATVSNLKMISGPSDYIEGEVSNG